MKHAHTNGIAQTESPVNATRERAPSAPVLLEGSLEQPELALDRIAAPMPVGCDWRRIDVGVEAADLIVELL